MTLNPHTSVSLLLIGCLFLIACSDSGDGMVPTDSMEDPANPQNPPQGPIEDPLETPVESTLFFKAPYQDTRDAGNAALLGFGLDLHIQKAVALVPEGTVDGTPNGTVGSATINCADQGSIDVSEAFVIEPNTLIVMRNYAFNDCMQSGSQYTGTLARTTEEFVSGAGSRTTTTHAFDLNIQGLSEGQGFLDLSGELTAGDQIEFNTPPDCPPANTLRLEVTVDEEGVYNDPVNGIAATFQSIDYSRSSTDRFTSIEPTCEAARFITYQAETVGEFSNIAAAPVIISKTGVFSSVGIRESDAPAVFQISALESDDQLTVSATGNTPTAVQVDIVDMNAIQSFTDNWDFPD